MLATYPKPRTKILIISALALLIALSPLPGAAVISKPSPQYTNIAPLPGAGIAINSSGDPDGLGAMQINIPVAYTPRWGFTNESAYLGHHPGGEPADDIGNGTGVFGLGFGNKPAVYMSGMQSSHIWSEAKALNGQLSVLTEREDRPAVSVGTQDILKKEIGNRANYIVTTKMFTLQDHRVYATLGYGGGRFLGHPFGGISIPVGERLNLAAEWDGYQINTGLGWRPGGRKGWATVLMAYNGEVGMLVGVGTAFKLGGPR